MCRVFDLQETKNKVISWESIFTVFVFFFFQIKAGRQLPKFDFFFLWLLMNINKHLKCRLFYTSLLFTEA